MLYILIPCLILLVVAIVLKKRESANNQTADKGKKTPAKKTSKSTTSRTSRPATTPTKVAATPTATDNASTALDTDVRSSIENLIKAQNYFAAEAKINQALNQDNTQHELYLYLFDIHVAQKDDFAINQLINYLRSLGLHDIADQAEQKQQLAQLLKSNTVPLTKTSSFVAPDPAPIANDQSLKSTAVFDELINTPSPAPQTTNFESIQADLDTPRPKVADHAPIEYSVEPKAPVEEKAPLEFDVSKSVPEAPIEDSISAVTAPVEQTPTPEIAPLEFNFTAPKPKVEEKVPEPLVEDFVFSENLEEKPINKAEPAHEFKLDGELPVIPEHDFKFNLDTPLSADPNSVAFEKQQFELAPEIQEASAEVASEADSTDPLAQSFPELLNINEIQLNLDLASRYIELGAYDSAKKLLNMDVASLTAQQREHSQKLLNQIAS